MTEDTSPANTHIAFIGLGVMGRPMAMNLAQAGYPVRAYDINPAALDAVRDAGVSRALSPADAAGDADFIITMVVNDAQMVDVLAQIADQQAFKKDSVVIGMSTMRRATVQDVAKKLASYDVGYLDAPVSGGEAGAQSGALSIMAGGSANLYARCLPVLQVLGDKLYHVGESAGDGQAVKMINQLLVCVHNAVAAEALAFSDSLGLDRKMVFEIIGNSAGNSWIFQNRGQRMLSREFTPPKSALSILVKDLGFVVEAANQGGFPLPLGSAAHQLYKMAAAQGWSSLDDSILIQLMEVLAGEHEPHPQTLPFGEGS
jgi:3-hydroxyisobutyrate dehydrogenase